MERVRVLSMLVLFAVAAAAQDSRIELRSHYSTILGMQKNFNILLPEGYDHDSLRYPVLYLFRGHEREWANPIEDASRRGNIKTVVDRLRTAGTIGPMILVMPGLGQPGTPADFAYVVTDLIPHVDAHFRTIPVRQKRGMDGFSYGGYDMLELLRRYPEQFYTAGAYDGSFWVVNLTQFFAGATEEYWNLLRQMKFMIQATPSGNYSSNQQFLSILASHGITNVFDSLSIAAASSHNWYFADLHMEQALPHHWHHLLTGSDSLGVRLLTPGTADVVAGTVPVRWSVAPPVQGVRTVVDVSRNRGAQWQELYSSTDPDTSFPWNSTLVQDGTGYMLRVRLLGDTAYGYAQSAGRFTVNNPGNSPPEAGILSPDSLATLTGSQVLRWWAEDAEGDSLAIALGVSSDGGGTWVTLAEPPNTGVLIWNTTGSPNSSAYRLRVRVSDGAATGEAISAPFAVRNPRPSLQPSLVSHVTGTADGTVVVHVVDSARVNGHRYRITFRDSLGGAKTYSVLDMTAATTPVQDAPVGSADQEGPAFDGLRLVLDDMNPPRVSTDSTRWITGNSNLVPDITLSSFDPGTGLITGIPYASDYVIQLFSHTVDTSSSLYNWPAAPMNFTVWNVTESHQVDVLFTDLNGDGLIGQYDDLILLEADSAGEPVPTWDLLFAGTSTPILPLPGDVFLFKVLKPFTSGDMFEFEATPAGIVSVGADAAPVAFRLEQNYPNPFNPWTTIRYSIGPPHVSPGDGGMGSSRGVSGGSRPGTAWVRLAAYDLLGRQVALLVDEPQGPGVYTVVFDGSQLASGVYFTRLTSGPDVQSHRMILLK